MGWVSLPRVQRRQKNRASIEEGRIPEPLLSGAGGGDAQAEAQELLLDGELDGEIVIRAGTAFSFDDLLHRIHPAESRVKKLSIEHPAQMIVYDLLVSSEGKLLTALTLEERRLRLEEFFGKNLLDEPAFQLSPSSTQVRDAEHWLKMAGGAFGWRHCQAFGPSLPSRCQNCMQKIKKLRSAELCRRRISLRRRGTSSQVSPTRTL